jgi:hypothetical protein
MKSSISCYTMLDRAGADLYHLSRIVERYWYDRRDDTLQQPWQVKAKQILDPPSGCVGRQWQDGRNQFPGQPDASEAQQEWLDNIARRCMRVRSCG